MKSIDLMTYYQAQPCLEGVLPYISIRKVYDRTKRMGKYDEPINLTDFWFEILESEKRLQGQYIGQHFCLLSDENTEKESREFWEKQNKNVVALCLIKVCAEIPQMTIPKAQRRIERLLEKVKDIETKFYRTVDNADLILFIFGKSEERIKKLIEFIKRINCRGKRIFYSFYSLQGIFKYWEQGSRKEYQIRNIKMLEDSWLQKNVWKESSWCRTKILELQGKMDACIEVKNRKWASYYQIINQILNLLCQYEQQEKFKDLFYVFYPPMRLFLEQLEEGQQKIKNNINDCDENKNKIETTVSQFVDSMEILIHHIGISCVNILNIDGRNGLPYDIPVKLCMMYLASLHAIVYVINNEKYKYQFCLSPLAYSRPTTNVFDFGLEPKDRLIRVSIARQKLFAPRALLGILTHEVMHYVGDYRNRKKRAEYYIYACSLTLVENLLPDREGYYLVKKYNMADGERKAFWCDWKKRKERIYDYFVDEIYMAVKNKNIEKEQKYHFVELCEEVKDEIANLLYDANNTMYLYINEVDDELKEQLMITEANSSLFEACEDVRKMLNRNLLVSAIRSEVYERVDNLKYAFKEIYADIASILLLRICPYNYLENYLLSEGCVPEASSTTNLLINRIAIVKSIMSQVDSEWEKEWNELDEKALSYNLYLVDLKQRVDSYLEQYEGVTDMGMLVNSAGDNEFERFDPFLTENVITWEKEYMVDCVIELLLRIHEQENEPVIYLLRNLYQHFGTNALEEKTFSDFFESFDKLIQWYKKDIKSEWNS